MLLWIPTVSCPSFIFVGSDQPLRHIQVLEGSNHVHVGLASVGQNSNGLELVLRKTDVMKTGRSYLFCLFWLVSTNVPTFRCNF